MTVLAPKTRKPAPESQNLSGIRTIVGLAALLVAAIVIQSRMRPARDDGPDVSRERDATSNKARPALASSRRPAPIMDSTLRIESRKPRYIAPRPPPPVEEGYGFPLIAPDMMDRQVHYLREYAATAKPGDPLVATEEDIESLRRHGSPLTW